MPDQIRELEILVIRIPSATHPVSYCLIERKNEVITVSARPVKQEFVGVYLI